MPRDDRSYFERRVAAEIERAQQAALPSVVKAHYQLAEAYLDKLASLEKPVGQVA